MDIPFLNTKSSRIVNAMFLAQLIECSFACEAVHRIKINIWGDDVWLVKPIFMLADQRHIALHIRSV